MGRLERHLDLDLIALVEAGSKRPKRASSKRRKPRLASSYRAARRNDVLRGDVAGVWPPSATGTIQHPHVRANRSRRWAPFKGRMYAIGSR